MPKTLWEQVDDYLDEDSEAPLLADDIVAFAERQIELAAKLAENPYSDEVQVIGREEPLAVGKKIAAAIRKMADGGAAGTTEEKS